MNKSNLEIGEWKQLVGKFIIAFGDIELVPINA